MTDPRAIQEQTRHYAHIRAALLARCPDLAVDEQALFDTLEGLTELREMLVALERSRQEDELLITGLQARLEAMTARLRRYQHRSDAKREALRQAMEQSGLDKIEEPDFTISLRRLPAAMMIFDVTILAEKYVQRETTVKILKAEIMADLKKGVVVYGAQLGNGGMTVSIRMK